MEQQIDELRGLCHAARAIECDAIVRMSGKAPPKVPPTPHPDHPQAVPFILWNPLHRAWSGLVEIEAGLDHRPLFGIAHPDLQVIGSTGKPQPFQPVSCGHNFMPSLTWRRRVLTAVTIPARSSVTVSLGWVPGCPPPPIPKTTTPAGSGNKNSIANGWFEVAAQTGQSAMELRAMKPKVNMSAAWIPAFRFLTVKDSWGPWGGHYDEPGSFALNSVLAEWTVRQVKVVESGPLRAALAVKLQAGRSEAELIFQLEAGLRAVNVLARVFWHEENARLKMSFPVGAQAIELQVPGGTVTRGECGEGPGGRWVKAVQSKHPFALSTDALYDFDLHAGSVQATIVRSSHYTQSEPILSQPAVSGPVIDRGEYCFRFMITNAPEMIASLSEELEFPPAVQMTWWRS